MLLSSLLPPVSVIMPISLVLIVLLASHQVWDYLLRDSFKHLSFSFHRLRGELFLVKRSW